MLISGLILTLLLLAVQAESQDAKSKLKIKGSSIPSNHPPWKMHSYYLPSKTGAKPDQSDSHPKLKLHMENSTYGPEKDLSNNVKVGVPALQAVALTSSKEAHASSTSIDGLYSLHGKSLKEYEELPEKHYELSLQASGTSVKNLTNSPKYQTQKTRNPSSGHKGVALNNSLRVFDFSYLRETDFKVDPDFEHLPEPDSEWHDISEIDPEFEHLPRTTESLNYSPSYDWEYEFPTQKEYRDETNNLNIELQPTETSNSGRDIANEDVSEEYYFDSYEDNATALVGVKVIPGTTSVGINPRARNTEVNSNEDEKHVTGTLNVDSAVTNEKNFAKAANRAAKDIVNANGPTEHFDEQEEYDYALGNDLVHKSLKDLFLDTLGVESRSFVFNPVASPNEDFQECTTPRNESGHCKYVQHCFLPGIISSIGNFMSYVCIIKERYIGICCPEFPVHSVEVKWEQLTSELQTGAEENITHPEGGCGISSKTRIVGGSKADPKEWPWMAGLLSEANGKFFCGGSLINSKYVLTAAHCTIGVPRNQILVRLGEYDFSDPNDGPGEDYPVVEIKRHGQYSRKTLRNDIALLKLARSATFGQFVSTICLPESNSSYVGQMATLAGWGNIKGGGPISKVLLEASFPVWSNSECSRVQGIKIHKDFICAGARSKDKGACNGDSGGPLMLLDESAKQWKAIGVVSWGRRGCDTRYPSVFTRVSNYLNWIKAHSQLTPN